MLNLNVKYRDISVKFYRLNTYVHTLSDTVCEIHFAAYKIKKYAIGIIPAAANAWYFWKDCMCAPWHA
jgi:hypothetical protein